MTTINIDEMTEGLEKVKLLFFCSSIYYYDSKESLLSFIIIYYVNKNDFVNPNQRE